MAMTNDTEPRALSAALSAPAFVTRSHGAALHAANRHVERWAPESSASQVRPMRSLGFVDRLVAPWMETAQRSASLRLFSQYRSSGLGEREGGAVSWVFPRPWYQDELDWMAAARHVRTESEPARAAAPQLLTTRGTYVRPEISAPQLAMPTALYEFVAPSLSLAASRPAPIAGVGYGGDTMARGEAYSPLVSLASVQAAELMSRAIAPLAPQPRAAGAGQGAAPPTAMTPGLRSVLTAILERAAVPRAHEVAPTRLSAMAPELVTPPHPRAEVAAPSSPGPATFAQDAAASSAATRVADQYAAQHDHLVELQRIAQQSAQRELTARLSAQAIAAAAAASSPAASSSAAQPSSTVLPEAAAVAAARTQVTQAAIAAARGAAERAAAETSAARGAEPPQPVAPDANAAAERARAVQSAEAQSAAARAEQVAERIRVEQTAERVAQRITERAGTQRLHEQARAEAAAHAARAPITSQRPTTDAGWAPATPVGRFQAPAEVTAAIAGLPPELAALLGSAVTQRPERAMQAINELSETLRTVELLARSSAAGTAFEATRGPRLMMPAGLGGLVNAVDRAQSIAERPAALGGQRPLAPLVQFVEPQRAAAAPGPAERARREARVPTLSWLTNGPAAPRLEAPATALAATSTASPVALSHVAWADRWLARFAGAAPQSLDMISAAAAASPAVRLQALASAAPDAVFVAPLMRGDLEADAGRPSRSLAAASDAIATSPAGSIASPAAAQVGARPSPAEIPGMRLINQPPGEPLRRFDDSAETPDDVFAAISAAASRGRTAAPGRTAAASSSTSAVVATSTATTAPASEQRAASPERSTLADLVAHAAPSAPGAGLSAQLASSPFAPALRHILPMPSAASFDVRSLFGAGLGATYLAGLIGPASYELEIGAQRMPTWASWSEAPLAQRFGSEQADQLDRLVPSFDAAYVSPELPDARALEQRAGFGGDASDVAAAAQSAAVAAFAAASPTDASAPSTSAPAGLAGVPAGVAEALSGLTGSTPLAALTTLRTALLSWELSIAGQAGDPGAQRFVPTAFAGAPSAPEATGYSEVTRSTIARVMIDAMSAPMLSDSETERSATWASPGMLAERAHAWSVAQERSSSDLALDFVSPELVLAARVYGLGPAEAAQAARLAIVGPGQLGAMASTVDRTFVEALAIGRDARNAESRSEARTAAAWRAETRGASSDGAVAGRTEPAGDADVRSRTVAAASPEAARAAAAGVIGSSTTAAGAAAEDRAAIRTAFPTADGAIAAAVAPTSRALPPASGMAFGVDRRAPRGAFLWPSATIAALGMTASGSDGQLSMSVAALELLAAQVVAELGTYTALSEADTAARELAGESSGGAPSSALQGAGADVLAGVAGSLSGASGSASAAGATPGALAAAATSPGAARATAGRAEPGAEPGEADVLGAAAALVPGARRARFEALYVALSQSSAARSWSPAARAARALALAGRGEPVMSARERAAAAWDVLPVVYPTPAGDVAAGAMPDGFAEPAVTGAAAAASMMSNVVATSEGGGGRRSAGRGRGAGGRGEVAASPFDDGPSYVGAPGIAGLSARAGEALGAYVSPVSPPSMARSGEVVSAAAQRAPSAASDYVHTGSAVRSGGRYGGGEVEIPAWFESAARKMLVERSGDSDGISMAELTLITAAPASHVAASSRGSSGTASSGPSGASTAQQAANTPKIDVERLAHDLFRELLVQMDVARERNGDPYL